MYLEADDHRPRSLFDSGGIDERQLAIGAAITAGVHVALPLIAAGIVAVFAAVGITLGAPDIWM